MNIAELISRTATTTAMVAIFCAWSPLAAEQVAGAAATQKSFQQIQSIGHDLGSKLLSGYFVQHESACVVTLMIIENGGDDGVPAASAARVRLILAPGQVAGLDSEEGRSVNFTCSDGGATLVMDAGQRERLVEQQFRGFARSVALSR